MWDILRLHIFETLYPDKITFAMMHVCRYLIVNYSISKITFVNTGCRPQVWSDFGAGKYQGNAAFSRIISFICFWGRVFSCRRIQNLGISKRGVGVGSCTCQHFGPQEAIFAFFFIVNCIYALFVAKSTSMPKFINLSLQRWPSLHLSPVNSSTGRTFLSR